jgi:hypothetical protein
MVLKIVVALSVIAVGVLTITCATEFVEVRSHDGFRLSFPQWRGDAEIAVELEAHDVTANTVLASQDPRGEATTLRGPEGITFLYGPKITREIYVGSLQRIYGPEMTERIVSGEFLHSPGPEERRFLFLVTIQGMSADAARLMIDPSGSYAYKNAYADALREREIARQEHVRAFVAPTQRTVEDRIAEARKKVLSMPVCRILKTCGLLWW